MREILFRGKAKQFKEWEYGYYVVTLNGVQFIKNDNFNEVDPETVGQFTGLTDKNGRKIFEGDIAKGNSEYFAYSHPHGIIVYDSGEFLIAFDKALEDVENLGAWANDIEVIGNIYDNPELLNGGDDNAEKIP